MEQPDNLRGKIVQPSRFAQAYRAGKKRLSSAFKGQDKGKPGPKVDKRHKIGSAGWAESGRWVSVKSSNVAGIKYDYVQKHLYVQFLNDAIYLYSNVSTGVAKGMFDCPSMGRFVWRHLRGRYPYSKISG